MFAKTLFAKPLIAVGLLGLAVSVSQPAFAGTRLVGYADLDLNTKEGQAQLNSRLRKAAKDVCGLSQRDLPSSEWESARQCYQKALADARKAKAGVVEATVLASAKKSKSDLAVR